MKLSPAEHLAAAERINDRAMSEPDMAKKRHLLARRDLSKMLAKMAENPGFIGPDSDYKETRPQMRVIVDKTRAADLGVSANAIGTALETDRTLGGLCDWVEPEAPASVDLPIEGAAALKAAIITVVLHYTTNGPLA